MWVILERPEEEFETLSKIGFVVEEMRFERTWLFYFISHEVKLRMPFNLVDDVPLRK